MKSNEDEYLVFDRMRQWDRSSVEVSILELTYYKWVHPSTGDSANMAIVLTLGSIASLLAVGGKPLKYEKVAIFSDALNHASIIDGIHLADRQRSAELFVYRHCDIPPQCTFIKLQIEEKRCCRR
ncbi:hypothetical protein SLEP1_g21193 [Rubroshorea leprosula]|uniref:Uncharacterized protein n=1 Tax=Rubroshorea leprosula TaxID=152421 RepID=A0AAV5JDW7_9ROSI|nr:hypothetical protein SLEP1_g21193 [Rubroshorea leprosula]